MKKNLRAIAALILIVLILGLLAGCSSRTVTIGGAQYKAKVGKGDYTLQVGERKISKNDFSRKILELRTLWAEDILSENLEFWQTTDEAGKSLSDSFLEEAQTALLEDALYLEQFDALGLKLTDAQQEEIGQTMQSYEALYGSRNALVNALLAEHYTYDEFRASLEFTYKKRAVLDHYFPEFNEEKAKAYYAEHNAVIRTIYISKLNPQDDTLLEGEELAEAKARAEKALKDAQAPSEQDRFEELVMFQSDAESSFNAMVVTDDGQYDEALQKVVFGMEIGGVTLYEMEDAFWIIKRYDATAEDVFGAAEYYAVLQQLNGEKIQSMLREWAKSVKIRINPELMDLCRPEKFMAQ